MGNFWQVVVVEPTKTILSQVGSFLTNLLLVFIILIVGWLIAKVIKALVIKVLTAVKVDTLSDRIELDTLLAKGGIKYSLSDLIGVVCYWLMILVTVMVALNAVGLSIAADLLNKVVTYIPSVIAAIFILILGMFVATILGNIVITAANNAGIPQPKLVSRIAEIVVVVFTIAIALEQLQIGAEIIKTIVQIVLGSVGLAVGLAFGMGCKDIAARTLSDWIEKLKRK